MVDPDDENPVLLCRRCAERAALAHLLKRTRPTVRRVHDDDPDVS